MVDSAELFEAISHPVRIKILETLEKQPSSFASLKRQLDIDSSGNLDYHLKKLAELVKVREDGLYGLTDAGKEALLSIEAIETWTEGQRRQIRVASEVPKEVLFLGLWELCTSMSIFSFLATGPVTSQGYVLPSLLLFGGLCSAFGLFTQQKWSWKTVLAKSALVVLMGFFLLDYWIQPNKFAASDLTPIYYAAFFAAEIVIVILALRTPLKGFLGVRKPARISFRAVVASLLCISSGILLIILRSLQDSYLQDSYNKAGVFKFISDLTILCGLAIAIGGFLIMLRSYIAGALLSIILGFWPPPNYAFHAFDIVSGYTALGPFASLIAVFVGLLPIIGGTFALFGLRKIPE